MTLFKTDVKICGIKTPEAQNAAVRHGARFVGFVFYPPSPRHLEFETAWNLARMVPTGVRSVGLFVDPDDALIDQITSGIQLDMIQLHGGETPGRINEIKQRTNMPVMKAIRVASADDLEGVEGYEAAADWLLFDSRISESQNPGISDDENGSNPEILKHCDSEILLPGGTGHSFDWNILAGREFKKPWMLGGGLHAGNVAEALSVLQARAVDVSSGVESARGQKDPQKIEDFLKAVKSIQS